MKLRLVVCALQISHLVLSMNERSMDNGKRKSIISPQDYLDAIQQRANQSQYQSLHPGLLFEDLVLFLKNPSTSEKYEPSCSSSEGSPFATLFPIEDYSNHRHPKAVSQTFQDAQKCIDAMRDKAVSDPQILFLKGYPSPEWVKSIGGCCRIDPEFFRWQLRFRCRREYSFSPSLPSTFENIVRLRFTTIGEMNPHTRNQPLVEKLREMGAESLSKYKHTLKVGSLVRKGDSIVRDYFVLDARHFIIEQEMSICVQPLENSWVAIVCSDAGRDLSLGPPGPWTNIDDRKYSSSTIIYPTIQHLSRGFSRANSNFKVDSNIDHGPHFQSASLLPEQFAATLDTSTMRVNPFYALTELFRFSAFSENQFLNLMEQKIIPDAGYQVLKQETPTLSNLLYFQEILEAHIIRIKNTVKVIRSRGSHWATSCERCIPVGSASASQRTKADTAASMLLEDFEYLLERAETLKHRCDQGMAVIMNNAILAESKRAIHQAKGVAKLTQVAFFYIPFSFTTSFYGMNFQELGTGKLSVWAWFATSLPVFLITLAFLLLDRRTFRSLGSKLRHWVKLQIRAKSKSSKVVGIAA